MKIIIIDDDPTGSQTVHNCYLLLKWDYKTLFRALKSDSKLLFILANTRSLSRDDLKIRLKEICFSLKKVLDNPIFAEEDFIFISRGDSTLRGHNFLEPFIINQLLGPFDATFYIPAFIEGNRITINGSHFVNNIPVHETIFAKDKVFGFATSNIKELLYKQSNCQINKEKIENITITDLESLDISNKKPFFEYIKKLSNNTKVIVDAKNYSHLNQFSFLIKELAKKKKFLFRTAASFISSLSSIETNNKQNIYYSQLRRKNKNNAFMQGIIIVGSYVELTTLQLNKILELNICKAIEINVEKIYALFKLNNEDDQLNSLKKIILNSIRYEISQNLIPVLFTSRKIICHSDENDLINFNNYLSVFIAEIVSEIRNEIGYLISKGGVTTNYILSKGFNADEVYLEGQILPGISLVTLDIPNKKDKLPIVTFPGNIGNEIALVKVLEILENKIF